MKFIFIILFLLITTYSFEQNEISRTVANSSRNSCVKIISKQGNSSGTGFFISSEMIVTCFHVIAQITIDNVKGINFNIFPDLQAVNENGDTVLLNCISIPNNQSPEPLLHDFAILKTSKIITKKSIVPIATKVKFNIVDPIIFTGYPFGTPTMVSHIGTISGYTKDTSLISIQASTNKGNSGGALMDKDGNAIGIVSLREGGISLALQNYLEKISGTEKIGSISFMGVDPLQTTKETILVLDTYISTGIGYAINIMFLSSYIRSHKIKL